nr:2925_t:CDS:2 [Entrophospora candida]
MTKNAQTEFEGKFKDKDTADPLELDSDDLEIKGYKNTERINLTNHSLDSLTIVDCPKLKKIDIENCQIPIVDISKMELDASGGKPVPNKLTNFTANNNAKLNNVNLENCKKLQELHINRCGEIKELKGTKDFADSLNIINFEGTTGLHFSGTNYLERLQEVEKVAKDILGGDIPLVPGSDKVDADKLKKDAEAKAIGNNVDLSGLGLTGSDATSIDKIKEKLQQATQAVNNLLNEIGGLLKLTDITKEKVINKINELMANGPSCTHTDYDEIKQERDDLKKDAIKKADMIKNDKEVFGKLGIPLDEYNKKVVSVSASEFCLNDDVIYKDNKDLRIYGYEGGPKNYIYCLNQPPFSDYQVGDWIEIDLDKTNKLFISETNVVRKISLSDSVSSSLTSMFIGSTINRQRSLAVARELDAMVDQSGGTKEYTANILKEFQEGVDFTIERGFFEESKVLIPFKTEKNKKDNSRELEKKFEGTSVINITYQKKNIQGINVNNGQLVNFQVENPERKLIEPGKEKSPNLAEEEKEIKNSPKQICYPSGNEEEKDKNSPDFKKSEERLGISQNNLSPSNSNFPTGLVIGGGVLLAVIGLVILFTLRNRKKKRL